MSKMKLYSYLVVLILTFALWGCSSDSHLGNAGFGSISGSVSDRTTGDPVPTASVMIKENGKSTVTGYDGSFSFTNLDPGNYTIEVSKDGYSSSVKALRVSPGDVTQAHLLLERLPASIVADKVSLDFETQIETLSFTIVNRGYKNLEYVVETGSCKWLTVEPSQGILKYGNTETIVVKLLRDQLPMGNNESIIVVRSVSGDGNVEIKVTAINSRSTSSVNTLPPTNVESNSATLCGEITQAGEPKYTERGFVYSDKSTPTVDDCIQKLSSPVNDDTEFTNDINNLTALTTYYVRAYVIQEDEIIYGNVVSFTTSQQNTVVTTSAATSVGATSATLNGSITQAGTPAFTEKGFCYSTNSNPTISDNRVTVSGNSVGDFSVTRYGLSYPTTYYARAYAIQSGSVVYGNIVSFTTYSTPVNVTTSAASQITSTSAILNGSIEEKGTPPYNERGFCLTDNYNDPTISDTRIIVNGNGITGNFSTQVNNLNYDTRYKCRAYAIQNGKPTYGATISFWTSYTKASVVTMDASNIKYTTATFNGSVTNIGDPTITEYGFCYSSTYDYPSIGDKKIGNYIQRYTKRATP